MADLQLDTLEAKGLIRLAAFQPELEYLFRHALVQDAAYESLLKQERRALHLVVGDAVEELYPERMAELAAVLAMHYEQAGETDKAIRYLTTAARFAHDRNAIVEAHQLYGRAEALLPPPSADEDPVLGRTRVEIGLGKARSGFSFTSDAEMLAMLEPIVERAEQLGDPRLAAEAHLGLAVTLQFRGDRPDTSPDLKRSLDRVAQIARELDDPLIAALPQSIIGLSQVFNGDLRGGVKTLSEAAPLLEQKHDFVGSSFALVALAIGYARLGEFEKAEHAAQRASEVAEKGDVIARIDALIGESVVRSVRGDLDQAVPLAMKCTNLAEEAGATACIVASNFVLGDSYLRQGELEAAKIAFERGNNVAEAIAQPHFRPSIAAYLRATEAGMGEFGPHARTFDDALAEARKIGDRFGEANVIWKRAETELMRPDVDREKMLGDFEAAAAAFDDIGARPYLARVQRHWGRALRVLGRTDEGEEKLRQALQLFKELGIHRDADEVQLELATKPMIRA
jgi:tetratricopeptide (TPR) repeat protein